MLAAKQRGPHSLRHFLATQSPAPPPTDLGRKDPKGMLGMSGVLDSLLQTGEAGFVLSLP